MAIDIEQQLVQARAYTETGNNDEARECLLEVLKEDPDHQSALLMLGGEYFTSGKLSEAEMIFERLILLSPGTGQFSIALFNTLWRAGRHEEALEEIRRFLRSADQEAEAETIQQYAKITAQLESE